MTCTCGTTIMNLCRTVSTLRTQKDYQNARIQKLRDENSNLLASGLMESRLNADIREAIEAYYLALDRREHGDIAGHQALERIQQLLGMSSVQGAKSAKTEPDSC